MSPSKPPTIQDVADAVGLSMTTVSYALRGERGSEQTRRRVREAADRLGYEANSLAATLAGGQSRTVAVLCGSLRDAWQQTLVADLSRSLLAAGRHALVADADGDAEQEEALLSKLRAQRPGGLLVAPLDPFAPLWKDLALELPVVSIGDKLSEAPDAGAVIFDNASGFRAVFDYLTGLGHSHFAVVLPERPSTPDRPAHRLVAEQAQRCGVRADLIHIPPATANRDEMTQQLVAALRRLETATAVFCLADSFAFAVLRAARILAIEVPRQLSVIGFENVEISDLVGPGLSTVDWGRPDVVAAAVESLLSAAAGSRPAQTRVFGPALQIRGTTGPVPRG